MEARSARCARRGDPGAAGRRLGHRRGRVRDQPPASGGGGSPASRLGDPHPGRGQRFQELPLEAVEGRAPDRQNRPVRVGDDRHPVPERPPGPMGADLPHGLRGAPGAHDHRLSPPLFHGGGSPPVRRGDRVHAPPRRVRTHPRPTGGHLPVDGHGGSPPAPAAHYEPHRGRDAGLRPARLQGHADAARRGPVPPGRRETHRLDRRSRVQPTEPDQRWVPVR